MGPLLWELRVLATGPPGKHLVFYRVLSSITSGATFSSKECNSAVCSLGFSPTFRDGLNWFNSIMYSFVIGIGGICLAYG